MKSFLEEFNKLVDFVFPILNQVHGVNKDRRYWSVVLFAFTIKILNNHDFPRRIFYDFTDLVEKRNNFLRIDFKKNSLVRNLFILRKECHKSVIVSSLEYLIFRLTNFGRGKVKREILAASLSSSSSNELYILYKYLPEVYVEDFDFYSKYMYETDDPIVTYSLKDARAIIYANRIGYKPLKFYQHGSFYGEVLNHPTYEIESELSDQFFTWGWKYNAKDIPWFSTRLLKFFENYNVNENISKGLKPIIFLPPYLERYRSCIVEILTKIGQGGQSSKVLLRPYIASRGNDLLFEEIMKLKTSLNLVFQERSKTYEVFNETSLIVLMSYPATAFLECLVVDKPVVVYVENLNIIHNKVMPYVNYFIQNKIFFMNLDEMIALLMTNPDSILDNWNIICRSDMYLEFKRLYCNISLRNDDSKALM